MPMPTCPKHPDVVLEPKKKGWYCEECDSSVLSYDVVPRPAEASVLAAPPAASSADALPTLLALPLRELEHEASPVLALWAACDLAEVALKLVVMAGVAEHVAASGKLPEALVRELRNLVELSTMGKWLGMARAVARHGRKESALPLAQTAASLEALLGGRDEKATDTQLLPLRNRLAHGGPVTKAEAARLHALWKPRVLAWANEFLAWLAQTTLVAVDEHGRRFLLRGEAGVECGDRDAVPPDAPATELRSDVAILAHYERPIALRPHAPKHDSRDATLLCTCSPRNDVELLTTDVQLGDRCSVSCVHRWCRWRHGRLGGVAPGLHSFVCAPA